MGAPFREFISLISLDGDFDLPQDLFIGLTDGHAQGGEGISGIEIEKAQKILMIEIVLRLQAAAGHKCVGNTDRCSLPKLHTKLTIIILLQETSVNDVGQVLFVIFPILPCKYRGNLL